MWHTSNTPTARARGLVLVENARGVVDRHQPAAKVDHLGAQPAVRLAERCGARFGGGGGVHRGGILAESVRGDKRIGYRFPSKLGSRNPTSNSVTWSCRARASTGERTSFMSKENTNGFCPGAPATPDRQLTLARVPVLART